jgi:hypothetical protein
MFVPLFNKQRKLSIIQLHCNQATTCASLKFSISFAGKMKGIAFIKDPDGYWIEIFDRKTIGNVTGGAA